jgi:pyruvate/2-oxoglutarate dehydrogenase complex dihydrolipoamide acyltransferase (E2) component
MIVPIIDVLLPQFGMGMKEGEIVRWHKAVGDQVQDGELLVEVEAAKTTVEVPAPSAGELVEVLAAAGETVPVRAVIARLRTR